MIIYFEKYQFAHEKDILHYLWFEIVKHVCVSKKMARTEKTPYMKGQHGDGVRPGTSQDTAKGEGAPKKLEKKG